MSKVLGIDLGTTNSAMAVVEGGQPKIIENAEGGRTTPSVVAISKNGERLVGQIAKRQAVTNPENTIYGIKRFMGHKYDDAVIQEEMKRVPYATDKADNSGVKVKMGDKWYSPEEVSSMILQKMKRDAEAKLGEKITDAVITVPAYFDDAQRKATKVAGEIAGFNVQRIINEPTAAALAYGFTKKQNEQIAVFDFGGGTFDITVLDVSEEVVEVKATDGDSHMGGEDIDGAIVGWITDEFKKEQGIDISNDPLARQRLKEAAEKAKHELSEVSETEINLPFITSDQSGPRHLLLTMKRTTLEQLAQPYIDKAIEITKRTVEASKYQVSDIDQVILVGGQTRMPAIARAVQELFDKEPNKSINPDEVVADGAAIQAGILQGDVKDVVLLDVVPLSLGIETMGGVATKLIERNTTIPASQTQTFSTAADNQTSVEVHIVQGERPMAADNKTLGKFMLDGIPPAPRGVPQIEVSFDIDANGILNVKAHDKTSGKEQSVRIEATSSLSDEEIERMRREAEEHAEEDQKKKEASETKAQAEQLIYTAEKSIKDAGEKLASEIKEDVEAKIAETRKAVEEGVTETIKSASEALSTAMQKIGEAMSQQAGSGESQDGGAEKGGEGAQTRDADYEEGESDSNSDEGKQG